MPEKPIAFIFPAFVTEYPGDPFQTFPGLEIICHSYLKKAAGSIDPPLREFHYIARNFLDDELRTQYMTYILCCAYADFLRDKNIVPDFCSGYSMGIYAAARQAGSVSFEDGLFLIRKAFVEISKLTTGEKYGMGTVLGLKLEDLNQIIKETTGNVEIANQNNRYSFIFSGQVEQIRMILDRSHEEGALNIRLLNVTIPYHSKILKPTEQPFSAFIESLSFKDPKINIISMIDQSLIRDSKAIKAEIARNLYTELNWYKTQQTLQNLGVRSFIECGPGKSLVKNAKFVEGDARFYSVSSLFDQPHPPAPSPSGEGE